MALKALFLLCTLGCVAGAMAAPSAVGQWAQEQEEKIAERVAAEASALRKVEAEYLARQDYALRIEREQKQLVRQRKLTTPEVAALQQQRAEMVKALEALDKRIDEAMWKAPEILELQTLDKANAERLEILRASLLPRSQRKVQPEAAPKEAAAAPENATR